MLELWIVVTAITLAFSIPVLVSSYYTLILFLSSLRYPKLIVETDVSRQEKPNVSVLVAAYNEKFVIGRTFDAIKKLDYPLQKLQVVVADDSTDDTVQIIDEKISELNLLGISSVVSRRDNREGYKSGALNKAAPLLKGDYTLLLDADSTVTSQVLQKGLLAFRSDPKVGFVSFRVGHYNREQNLITKLFALQLDQGDTVSKMGSYSIDAPFSFQGGYTLVSTALLRSVGWWTNDSIVDDADLSCKIYSEGRRGIYLSDVKIFGEDPPTLEVWKKQATRVAQGWAKCARSNWRKILQSPNLSIWKRLGLLITLLGPFSALSWIVVTFISALALLLGVTAPSGSIFSNPVYVGLVTIPVAVFFISGAYALWVQKLLTVGRLLLVPLISYTGSGLLTALSVGFLSGITGSSGTFFRTPKTGPDPNRENKRYLDEIHLDRVSIAEGVLAILALGLSISILQKGVWLLFLSLLGFGILTLKSMRLSRVVSRHRRA
ncbi:MAG TPA: glycosyltransferase family 2 protein [Candidatus Bathyarchaeia archaeon]|jgi:cellulose synthase/poly-beta-1,6-N-acetylglucosamine synthase-like glycosyltransferase|nr:glycosyltransferase family 2 protein [Candidatus Bathyarchaeia archaeon]